MYNERFVLENLRDFIAKVKNRVYSKITDLDMEIYFSKEPLKYSERKKGEYRKISVGEKWGDLFDCAWFHCTAKLPFDVAGKKIVTVIDVNGEGLIYDKDGVPYRGITNINSTFDRSKGNPGKRIVPFCEIAEGGETVDFWMDAGCNDLTGNLKENGTVKEAYMATCNDVARDLYYDLQVLYMQVENTPKDDPLRYELIKVLSDCRNLVCDYTDKEFEECLKITKKRLSLSGGDNPAISLTAFGHAHIDLAWLWPLRETRRKGGRTFSTAIDLMKRYDEYLFGASSPQIYQWTQEDYPELYTKIKKMYDDGRWELLGATWIEPDLNLISGESVVRHLLYGNAFWEKEFGERVNYVWTPDTFGYSAALPQIFKKAGIKFFSTIKMSWNLINKFPYTNFKWRGIDGSEILVHMPPEGCYLSEATPKSVKNVKTVIAQKGQFGESLLPYGIGDGGGGPSPYHLEYLRREKNLPGLCPISQGKMKEFFERFEKRADDFPVWDGEMYLERHLGVYTSAARNKKYNRLMEKALHDAEMLYAIASWEGKCEYPQSEFENIWKEVLLYQFHDVLPGSSIQRVYDESLARYEILYNRIAELTNNVANILADDYSGEKVIYNTLSFEHSYRVENEKGYAFVKVPAIGAASYSEKDLVFKKSEMTELENDILSVKFNDSGAITSIYNKKLDKELLNGESNVLYIYDDMENAWNLQYDYRNQKPKRLLPESIEKTADNCGVTVKQTYRYSDSTIEVSIVLKPESSILEFDVHADWHALNKMLRIRFDSAVFSDKVYCETQFGTVSRSTKNNTLSEQAQIEIAAHKWVALARPDVTFALLNDSKHGYSVSDNVIEINALRGTNYPATDLDFGEHTFRYGIFADNSSDLMEVVKQGYIFNNKAIIADVSKQGEYTSKSYIDVSANDVIIDGIKKAENSNDIIVRTYEAAGMPSAATLGGKLSSSNITLCDLNEDDIKDAENKTNYGPYEIVSYKIHKS